MSNSIDRLENRDSITKSANRKSLGARRMEKLNRSLDRISDNLRNSSKRKNQKFSVMLSSVEKMSQYLEKCAQHFDSVLHNKHLKKEDEPDEKPYSEWVKNLKNSKNGKKFISRIESSIRRILEKERKKITEEYSKKMENENNSKQILYKRKLLEEVENKTLPETELMEDDPKDVIKLKLEVLEKKHDELMKKISENEKKIEEFPANKLEMGTQTVKQIDDVPDKTGNILKKLSEEDKNCLNENDSKEIKKIPKDNAIKEFKPFLERMSKTIEQQERNIESIILDARHRVQQLEHESQKLDESFQDYLNKQKIKKLQSNEEADMIWRFYNQGKTILNKKYPKTYTSILDNYKEKTTLLAKQTKEEERRNHKRDSPKISGINCDITATLPEFENPFRKVQKDILEKESWRKKSNEIVSRNIGIQTLKPSIPSDAEKGNNFKDVGVQISDTKKEGSTFGVKTFEKALRDENLCVEKPKTLRRSLLKQTKSIALDKSDSELEISDGGLEHLEEADVDSLSIQSNSVKSHQSNVVIVDHEKSPADSEDDKHSDSVVLEKKYSPSDGI